MRDAVVAAYKKLYVNIEASNQRSGALNVAKNLIALVRISTVGELTSLEKLISELVASKDLGKPLFTVLWEHFTGVLPDSTAEGARSAIILLKMCAASEVSIITANVQVEYIMMSFALSFGLLFKSKNIQIRDVAINYFT